MPWPGVGAEAAVAVSPAAMPVVQVAGGAAPDAPAEAVAAARRAVEVEEVVEVEAVAADSVAAFSIRRRSVM